MSGQKHGDGRSAANVKACDGFHPHAVYALCIWQERAGGAHLIDEDDSGRVFLGKAEDIAHHAGALG